LIGGIGIDSLAGGGADDILIGGTTSFDANLAALNAIVAEWASADIYSVRVGRVSGAVAGGLNGSTFLNPSTVKSDLYIDTLSGGSGQNWFLYTSAGYYLDLLQDLTAGQVTTPLPK
jgi:hypothetical protein